MAMKRKLEDFGTRSAGENLILAEIDSGKLIELHNGLPPETPSEQYDVRAEFIRYFALGGCEACSLHEKGLRIEGARITGVLDLEGGDLPWDLGLINCRFNSKLLFRGAKMNSLFLSGSYLPVGLAADRLVVNGSVFMRSIEVHGEVRLLATKLGGDLDCTGAKFNAVEAENGHQTRFSFSADGLAALGCVVFNNVKADGEVIFIGAKLGGDLVCEGATFAAAKDKRGNREGDAFSADRLEVKGSFFLRGGTRIAGRISLDGAHVGALNDEAGCWPEGQGQIGLDRFRYDAILGAGALDAKTRIAWLDRLGHGDGFSPQPYEQLAKVLREMGHREDARDVMIKKEELQLEAQKPHAMRKMWNWTMRVSAGYGYHPMLSVRWLAVLALIGMVVFSIADLSGAVKPNSARVWHLDQWNDCVDNPISPKWCYLISEKGESYPAFNPIIYSIDTLLPIVDLEMQGAWIPDARANWWGIGARVYLWLHIALGWFFSLLAVAGFSGLIKPE